MSTIRAYTRPLGEQRGHPKDRSEDLRDIRQRGPTYQVRVFTGYNPVTDKQVAQVRGPVRPEE